MSISKRFVLPFTLSVPVIAVLGMASGYYLGQEVLYPFKRYVFYLLSLVFTLIVMLATVCTFLAGRSFTKPLKQLDEAVKIIAKGGLDYKIDIKTGDEVEELAQSFNKMTEELKFRAETEQKLYSQAVTKAEEARKKAGELMLAYSKLESKTKEYEKLKGELEDKVRERTMDLQRVQEATLNILEDLQESKDMLAADKFKIESMVESAVEGVIMVDNKGEIVVLNPQAKYMLGCEIDKKITNKRMNEILKNINLDEAFEECLDRKIFITREITIYNSEGEGKMIYCSISPVKNPQEHDEIIGVVIILRDVTKEKEVDRMKTEFISTVSHELRTPLSIIKEGISLVIDKIPGAINERQEKILFMAKDNIDRLARIIDSLLNISKIEAGKMELNRAIINITDLAKTACSSFKLDVKRKGLELKLEFPDKPVNIAIDADRIIRVFTNLVANALKFTERGYIKVSIEDLGEEVECSVADTGIGITKNDLPKVFEKFQQFSRTAGPGEAGTGLGLSIAKGIVDMHKGKIWVESELGKGTKFIFALPKHID